MAGTFVAGINRFLDEVGHGKIVASCEVDQVYAHNQEVHEEYFHPDGGKAFYLRDVVFERKSKYMRIFADGLITREGGSNLVGAAKEIAEDMSQGVFDNAPWEFADLRASGHPTVKDDTMVVYDRAPMVHRLDSGELHDKAVERQLFWPDRYRRR